MAHRFAVVTTSRADYGGLRHVLREMRDDPDVELQVVVSGMHLSGLHGRTVDAIAADGFAIARCVPMLLEDDDEVSIVKSVGFGVTAFAPIWRELHPDFMLCLGDRFELMAPVLAAFLQRVPIAHIHGGETSQGAVDEGIRHSISKMASVHFPATDAYAQRLIRMGEPPERVFAFGAPALDSLYSRTLVSREALAQRLQLDLRRPVALVTYHPVTLEVEAAGEQVRNMLRALERSGAAAVFTRANADASGSVVNAAIDAFAKTAPERYRVFDHLGQATLFDCLEHLDFMLGNSSSGLVEAPSFRIPVVNVGNRQKGRLRSRNVIDTGYETPAIAAGIERALSPAFRRSLDGMQNPYDVFRDGQTSRRIKETLKKIADPRALLEKCFHDVATEGER